MSADIFALLQSYTNTQTLQPAAQQTTQDATDIQHGLFAALMNECIAEGDTADFPVQMFMIPEEACELQNISEPQTMTFTGNNSFPQSVMNILAGEAENSPDTPSTENISLTENALPSPEIADDDSDKVIWPEDEVIDENPKAPESPDAPEPPETVEILDAPEFPDAPEISDAPESSGDVEPAKTDEVLPEFPEPEHAENTPVKVPDAPEAAPAEDTQPEFLAPAPAENTQPEIHAHIDLPKAEPLPEKTPKEQEAPEDTEDISEVSTEFAGLAGVITLQQDTQTRKTDTQTRQDTRNQLDTQPNAEKPETQSQPDTLTVKPDTRKLETRPQKQEARPQKQEEAPARRTESHSDFAAYFDGVLNSRRSTARTSQPMPLNLRTAENFTQAAALRDGLNNVVRFIRADGVQKARVIVDPPALGRVSVELTSGTSGVEASIKVASEQIRQLVQDQISQLRMNLSQQGVQVAEFTVDVQQDSSGNHSQQGQEQYAGRFGFVDDSDDDEAEDFRIDLEEGLLYWVA